MSPLESAAGIGGATPPRHHHPDRDDSPVDRVAQQQLQSLSDTLDDALTRSGMDRVSDEIDRRVSPTFFDTLVNGVSGAISAVRGPAGRMVFGDLPDFKDKQSRLILDTIIDDLAQWTHLPPPQFETDAPAELKEAYKQILTTTVNRIGLLEGDSSLNNILLDTLMILFNHEKFHTEDASEQRSNFMNLLTEIAYDPYYTATARENPADPRIQLAHRLAESVIIAPQWNLFEEVLNKVVAAGGRSCGLGDALQHESLADILEEEQSAIATAPIEWKMGTFLKNMKKLQGQLGFGFTPSQDTNYFSALFVERYRNSDDNTKEIPVYRFPTATEDGLAGGESRIVGAMRLWVNHLKHQDRRHCWFGHQKMNELYLDREGARSTALQQFHKENPETFFFFNLPLDGPLFDPKTDDHLGMHEFKRSVHSSILSNKDGFYFPEREIEELQRKLGNEFNGEEWISRMLDQVHHDFFSDQRELSKEDRQTFLLLFYTRMEREFPLLLDASRNSTCKDGIDRAAVMNALCYYMALVAMGKHKDPAYLYRFRIVLHHAAFFVKTQGVIPSRMKLLLNALRHLDSLDDDALQTLGDRPAEGEFRLQTLMHPQVKVRRIGIPRNAKNEQQFLAAIDNEREEDRIVQWKDFVHRNMIESPSFTDNTVPVLLPGAGIEEFEIPYQTKRDILTSRYVVGGTLIEGYGETKDEKEKVALQQLFDRFLDLTEGDVDQAWKLCSVHNQSITAPIFQVLSEQYGFQPEDIPEDPLVFIPRKISPDEGLINTEFVTERIGPNLQTVVTTDFEISKMSAVGESLIVRATLTIIHDGEFSLEFHKDDLLHALQSSQQDLGGSSFEVNDDESAPDATLTWEVGSSRELPPMRLNETSPDAAAAAAAIPLDAPAQTLKEKFNEMISEYLLVNQLSGAIRRDERHLLDGEKAGLAENFQRHLETHLTRLSRIVKELENDEPNLDFLRGEAHKTREMIGHGKIPSTPTMNEFSDFMREFSELLGE